MLGIIVAVSWVEHLEVEVCFMSGSGCESFAVGSCSGYCMLSTRGEVGGSFTSRHHVHPAIDVAVRLYMDLFTLRSGLYTFSSVSSVVHASVAKSSTLYSSVQVCEYFRIFSILLIDF